MADVVKLRENWYSENFSGRWRQEGSNARPQRSAALKKKYKDANVAVTSAEGFAEVVAAFVKWGEKVEVDQNGDENGDDEDEDEKEVGNRRSL